MRLLTKISLVYLLITALVLLIGSVITFWTVQKEIDTEHRIYLRNQLENLTSAIESGSPIALLTSDKIKIADLGGNGIAEPVSYGDTLVFHNYTKRLESNQKLQTVAEIGGRFYSISIHDIIVEPDDIVDAVRSSLIKILLLLLAVFITASVILSWNILRPFNETLESIRKFDLADSKPLKLTKSPTREFSRLNSFLEQMTAKSKQDYESLKEFTENASHEIQTPLAVSRGKLELLLESPNLDKDDIALVGDAQASLMKVSRIGRSLSLLTKIENAEFTDKQEVNMTELVVSTFQNFSELIGLNHLKIEKEANGEVKIKMDPALAEILVNNLVQNSIRHNLKDGWIRYKILPGKLSICNSGAPPEEHTEEYFRRFKKGNQSNESVGLGLSIVKRICLMNQFRVNYRYEEDAHCISVDF